MLRYTPIWNKAPARTIGPAGGSVGVAVDGN